MQTYTHYKESGIDWIEAIPKHWGIKRFKYLFNEINERSIDGSEDLLSVSQYTGVTRKSEKIEDGDLLTNASTLEGYKKVRTHQLVSNIMLAWNGSLAFSEYNGITSPAYCIYELKYDDNYKYFHYLFKTDLYKSEFKRNSSGVIESRLRLYTDDFFGIWSVLPPIQEQEAIANFLDEKTAKIDALVQTKEQQIEKLKELRQAKIHQAVTKGLDANAPTKDSGVEWIGEIPKYWEVLRVKQVTLKISKGTTPSTEGGVILDVGPIRYIKAENIQDDIIVDSPKFFIDYKTNELLKRSELKVNDLLFVIAGATLGKIAILGPSHVPSNTNQAISFLRPSKKIIPLYLKYWLKGKLIFDRLWQLAVQSAQPNLSMENLGNMPLFLPPIQEQEQIVTYLDEVTSKIDQAIAQKQEQITKLKEYKQSLINDVVTGKVKVC